MRPTLLVLAPGIGNEQSEAFKIKINKLCKYDEDKVPNFGWIKRWLGFPQNKTQFSKLKKSQKPVVFNLINLFFNI